MPRTSRTVTQVRQSLPSSDTMCEGPPLPSLKVIQYVANHWRSLQQGFPDFDPAAFLERAAAQVQRGEGPAAVVEDSAELPGGEGAEDGGVAIQLQDSFRQQQQVLVLRDFGMDKEEEADAEAMHQQGQAPEGFYEERMAVLRRLGLQDEDMAPEVAAAAASAAQGLGDGEEAMQQLQEQEQWQAAQEGVADLEEQLALAMQQRISANIGGLMAMENPHMTAALVHVASAIRLDPAAVAEVKAWCRERGVDEAFAEAMLRAQAFAGADSSPAAPLHALCRGNTVHSTSVRQHCQTCRLHSHV